MTSPDVGPVADSVRLAWPAEAPAIAALQRRGWAGLPPATGTPLLAAMTLDEMAEVWHAVITRPPLAQSRVLVAVEASHLVGFATTGAGADADADPGHDGEIDQLVVDPPARRRGHGSRLLNACADTLRADGFRRASCWVVSDDDVLRVFLTGAGWAPDGAHREIGTEDETVRLRQVRLHTDLTDA